MLTDLEKFKDETQKTQDKIKLDYTAKAIYETQITKFKKDISDLERTHTIDNLHMKTHIKLEDDKLDSKIDNTSRTLKEVFKKMIIEELKKRGPVKSNTKNNSTKSSHTPPMMEKVNSKLI